MLDELRRLADELRLADNRDGVVRTAGQRRAAALVEMAVRSASTPAGSQRPKPLFTALVGDESLTRLCELSTGRVVAPESLARFADTAVLETVLFDGPDTVVSVSRRRPFTVRCGGPSTSATGTASTRPVATCPPNAATSTTSSPGPSRGAPTRATAGWSARPTTATPTATTPMPRPDPSSFLTGLDACRARARWWCSYHDRTGGDADDEPGQKPSRAER